MTPTPSAGRRRSAREGARCRAADAAPVVIVAGPVRPAWTEGGLRPMRPGSDSPGLPEKRPGVIVAGPVRPAWTEGGLRPMRPGSDSPGLPEKRPGTVVAGPVRPAWTEGGLRPMRPGSDSPGLPEKRPGTVSFVGKRQRRRRGEGDAHRRTRRQHLVVPRVTDIHLEHDAGAHLDVVAQRASEVRGQHDPSLERVLGAGPERDVLGAHRQHAAIAGADPQRRRAPHGADCRLRRDAAGRDLAADAREKVVGADEVGDEPADRPLVELLGGRLLEHPAVAYHGDPVRERKRFFLIVRDVHGRDSQVLLQLADLGTHLYPDLRIEVRQRLVQEQDVRVQHEGAGERDALLLAAGELAGITELEARQVDLAEAGRDALGDRGTVELSHLESVGDVRLHRHVRPERIVLEHHADVTRVGPEPVDAPRSEEHTSELQSLAYLVCRLLLEKKKELTRNMIPL